MKITCVLVCILLPACARPQPSMATTASSSGMDDGRVQALLSSRPEDFAAVLEHAQDLRAQILWSEVCVRPDGTKFLARHGWRVDAEYFYPASSIKLLAALATCEVLDEIARSSGRALDLDTPLIIEPLFDGDPRLEDDSSHVAGGKLTLGHEIRKLFLISDNTAFNRLYDFLGRDQLNQRAWDAGLSSVRLSHRLSLARTSDENQRTPATWLMPPGEEPLGFAARSATLELKPAEISGLLVGRAQYRNDVLVEEPLDCTHRNRASLLDLQDALVALVRPELAAPGSGYQVSASVRAFLLEAMSTYPADSRDPIYDRAKYPDDWVKFLLPGLLRVIPREDLTVCNKVGLAYGFTIENAYVEDRRTGTTRAGLQAAVAWSAGDPVSEAGG